VRILLAVGLIALGALAAGFIGFIVWAHHMYTVGVPANFPWIAAAYGVACVALVAGGVWLLWPRRNSN
jgi:heme/copper-type cytochrome/quinol oxidase subunit 1